MLLVDIKALSENIDFTHFNSKHFRGILILTV